MSEPIRSNRGHVVVVHGVGSFNEKRVRASLGSIQKHFGLESYSISLFNWCDLVGDPFAQLPRLARAYLRLTQWQTTGPRINSFAMSTLRRVVGWLTCALQIVTAFVLPAVPLWLSRGSHAALNVLGSLHSPFLYRYQLLLQLQDWMWNCVFALVRAIDDTLLFVSLLLELISPHAVEYVVLVLDALMVTWLVVLIAALLANILWEYLAFPMAYRARRVFRRIVLAVTWGIVHTYAMPYHLRIWGISLWPTLFVLPFIAIPTIMVLLAKSLGFFLPVFRYATESGWGDIPEAWRIGIQLVCFSLLLWCTLRFVIYVPTKCISDVALWMGDRKYRLTLRERLASHISQLDLEVTVPLFIAGHSLGSVIAVDYLLSFSTDRQDANRVTLLTFGSPLRNLLNRAMPEVFPTSRWICQNLRARYPGFKWVNVYRRQDYIGRNLELPLEYGGVDVGTGQRFRMHTGYWNDSRVWECVVDGWNKVSHASSANEAATRRHGELFEQPVMFIDPVPLLDKCGTKTFKAIRLLLTMCLPLILCHALFQGWIDVSVFALSSIVVIPVCWLLWNLLVFATLGRWLSFVGWNLEEH